jgi:hypothetical protein
VFLSSCDVAGNDVNIANRLLGQAEPNGICISQTVYDVVKSKTGLKATYLGPVELKNIREHIPVYKLLLLAGEQRDRRDGHSAGAHDWMGPDAVHAEARPSATVRRFRGAAWGIGIAAALTGLVLPTVLILSRPKPVPPGRAALPPPAWVPAQGGVPAPVLAPAQEWRDLMPLVSPRRDALRGSWQKSGDELWIDASEVNNVLTLPVVPTGDYELEVSFTRERGDGDVVIYVPAPTTNEAQPPKQVTVHFGYQKKFDLLTEGVHPQSALAGENGKRFTALVQVTSEGEAVRVEVALDGRPKYLTASIARKKFQPYSMAWATRDVEDHFGLGADDVHVKFHSFRVKMLSGQAEIKQAKAAD